MKKKKAPIAPVRPPASIPPAGNDSWMTGTLPAMFCLGLLGFLLYANTLAVPWYLDDLNYVVGSESVQSLRQAWAELLFASRGLVQFTFALNYWFGTTSVFGYHLINILLHVGTSCFVFLILKRVFAERPLLAWGGALIFLVHPLQTQSVTYIYQRATCLAGLFFFLALYLYIRARETDAAASESSPARHWQFYGGAVVCGAVAVLAKPNAAVLPVALLLFDRYFLPQNRPQSWRQIGLYLAPFCLAPLILGFKGLMSDPMLAQGVANNVGAYAPLAHLSNNTPLNYLITQFGVIWIYVRLLFLPYGQALEYDVPVVTTFWHWPSVVGLLGIVLLLTAAVKMRKRLPVVSAGILWFFLALSIESSIIPLDTVFEHRLYVPMFGFALVVMAGIDLLPRRIAVGAIILLGVTLAVLTWQRNALWNDPVAFYEANLRRAPRNERVNVELGNLYLKHGRVKEAQTRFEEALTYNPGFVHIHINLANVYFAQKEYRKAIAILNEGLRLDTREFSLFNNLASSYIQLGEFRAAAEAAQKGIQLAPKDATVNYNLGIAYLGLGQSDQAIVQFRRCIELKPNQPAFYFNLGVALSDKGEVKEALQAFLEADRLRPHDAGTLYNIAVIYLQQRDIKSARDFIAQLQRIDPALASRLTAGMR